MIYRVVHVTEYRYDEPVSTSHHQLCLSPRPAAHQSCGAQEITISPAPVVRRERIDFFGNRCTHVEMQEPHRQLQVVSRFDVDVRPPARAASGSLSSSLSPSLSPSPSPSWESVRDALARPGTPELLDACGFTFESPHVQIPARAKEYALQSFSPGRPLLEALLELAARIHGEFTYDSRATTVSTPVAQVLSHRRG
ncbi:MAG: hypothetical protein QOI66_4453, partial [Myxococcales bacterium]|nr:hypothetical protein [Myxococcales bacterium]